MFAAATATSFAVNTAICLWAIRQRHDSADNDSSAMATRIDTTIRIRESEMRICLVASRSKVARSCLSRRLGQQLAKSGVNSMRICTNLGVLLKRLAKKVRRTGV